MIISLRSETPPALRVSATSNVISLKYNTKCKIVAAIASDAEIEAQSSKLNGKIISELYNKAPIFNLLPPSVLPYPLVKFLTNHSLPIFKLAFRRSFQF